MRKSKSNKVFNTEARSNSLRIPKKGSSHAIQLFLKNVAYSSVSTVSMPPDVL